MFIKKIFTAAVVVCVAAHPLFYAAPADAFGGNKGGMGMKQGGFGGGKKGMKKGNPPADAEEKTGGDGPDPEVMGAFMAMRANMDAMEARGFLSTGLTPAYPDGFDCPKVTSPFSAQTRSDGSWRSKKYFKGFHGGMDIPEQKGAPLIAMADGEVIVKHEGSDDGIGGLGLWLRHAPADTGLDKYVFIEYKHLDRLPPNLEIGQRVKMGEVIGEVGNTGTTGGHYGAAGFYHLHLTALWGDSPEYKFKRALIPIGGQWLDPLAFMRGGPLDSHAAKALSSDEKKVRFAFKATDGRILPASARVVYPFVCKVN